jgi:hypothetical protein
MRVSSNVKRQPTRRELELDRELEATFPASDPLKIMRRPAGEVCGARRGEDQEC